MNDYDYAINIYCATFELKDENDRKTACEDIYIRGVFEAIDTLKDREQLVLEYRYRHGLLLANIGEKIGVSSERARQIIAIALKKLRHPKRMNKISILKIIENSNRLQESIIEKNDIIFELRRQLENRQKVKIELYCQIGKGHGTRIEDMDLSVHAYKVLLIAGIYNSDSLLAINDLNNIIKMRGMGRVTLRGVLNAMRECGYNEWADSMERQAEELSYFAPKGQ